MSLIGSPITASIIQAAQAQQVASKARDRKRTEETTTQRDEDLVELRIKGLESADAVHDLPANDSEQAKTEDDAKDHQLKSKNSDKNQKPQIDITG